MTQTNEARAKAERKRPDEHCALAPAVEQKKNVENLRVECECKQRVAAGCCKHGRGVQYSSECFPPNILAGCVCVCVLGFGAAHKALMRHCSVCTRESIRINKFVHLIRLHMLYGV